MEHLQVEPTSIQGLLRIRLPLFPDPRGFFLEAFRQDRLASAGVPSEFVQDNQSRSRRGVVRGLHFQWDPPLGKLVRVAAGRAFFAFADIRKRSQTFRATFTQECADAEGMAFFVPPGVAAVFARSETIQTFRTNIPRSTMRQAREISVLTTPTSVSRGPLKIRSFLNAIAGPLFSRNGLSGRNRTNGSK